MTIIKTIALLCQLNGSGGNLIGIIEDVEKKQLKCQQYYVKCLGNPIEHNYKTLAKCVSERKL